MSRIDDALKRMTGGAAEPRVPSMLDRFASEGKAVKIEKLEEPKKGLKSEEGKVANFVPPGPHPVEARPVKAVMPAPVVPASPLPVEPVADVEVEAEADKLLDFRQIADYVEFGFRSIRRHKLLATATFVIALSMVIVAAVLMPRTYYVETWLLAQPNSVMAALSNPATMTMDSA